MAKIRTNERTLTGGDKQTSSILLGVFESKKSYSLSCRPNQNQTKAKKSKSSSSPFFTIVFTDAATKSSYYYPTVVLVLQKKKYYTRKDKQTGGKKKKNAEKEEVALKDTQRTLARQFGNNRQGNQSQSIMQRLLSTSFIFGCWQDRLGTNKQTNTNTNTNTNKQTQIHKTKQTKHKPNATNNQDNNQTYLSS